MHVMVLGAGVTGITAAWYLLEAGHQVTVIERREGVALETSFANGGQISISHPEPWSSPAAPLIALRSLFRADAPLKLRLGRDWSRYTWALSFLRECLPARHHHNAARIAALAVRSGRALRSLRERTGLEYAYSAKGILHLLHDRAALNAADERVAQLTQWGITVHRLSADECRALEPALNKQATLLGGLYAPDDESGDAHAFTEALAKHFVSGGGTLLTGHEVVALERRGTQVRHARVRTGDGADARLQADAIVVCLGVTSRQFLAPLGVKLPIYPVKGYSVTAHVTDPTRAPSVSLTDETQRLVCSRLGDRLRLAGTAELAGYDKTIDPRRIAQLCRWIDRFFPGATDLDSIEAWAGLRPCTPGYVPIIGQSGIDGLWLNTGHGSLGWTLACGSAELIRDLLDGRQII